MKPDLRDLHVYGGILLAGVGAGMLNIPSALLVVGLLIAYLGLRTA